MIEELFHLCREKHIVIATAESCTGGLIGAALTGVTGSSDVFDRGFITYSNEAKREMLGVSEELIADYGAVSEQVAMAMAEGTILHSAANLAVSVTGIAGPGGGSAGKPVGTVWIGLAFRDKQTMAHHYLFEGERQQVRQQTVQEALELLYEAAA